MFVSTWASLLTYMYISLFTYTCLFPHVHISFRIYTSPFAYTGLFSHMHVSFHTCITLSTCTCLSLHVYISFHIYTSLSTWAYLFPSVHVSFHMFVFLSIYKRLFPHVHIFFLKKIVMYKTGVHCIRIRAFRWLLAKTSRLGTWSYICTCMNIHVYLCLLS